MKKTLVALFVTGYVGIAFADQVVDTDIVVVGAGGAGFSAAVAAAEKQSELYIGSTVIPRPSKQVLESLL